MSFLIKRAGKENICPDSDSIKLSENQLPAKSSVSVYKSKGVKGSVHLLTRGKEVLNYRNT